MPENPNYQNPPQFLPTLEDDELDEATLDGVVGGLSSPNQMHESQVGFYPQNSSLQAQMQNQNRGYSMIGNILKPEKATLKNTITNIH